MLLLRTGEGGHLQESLVNSKVDYHQLLYIVYIAYAAELGYGKRIFIHRWALLM